MTITENPFRQALEKRIAEKRVIAAGVSDGDLAGIIRMLAVAAAAGDDRAIDRIAAAGPDMRRAIEAEIDRVIEEQRLALEERRREAGVTVAVDSPRPDKAICPAPEPERESTATAGPTQGHSAPPGCRPRLDGRPADLPPPGTISDYSGRTRPVPPPPFSAKRYGLREMGQREGNSWMWNR